MKKLAILLLLSATPAQADLLYTIDTGLIDKSIRTTATGSITTDGTFGPANVLDWNITITTYNFFTLTSAESFSGTGITDGPLTATPTSLVFGDPTTPSSFGLGSFQIVPVNCSSPCYDVHVGTAHILVGIPGSTTYPQIAIANNPVAVPGPILGAGLPGIVAVAAFMAWWRAKRLKLNWVMACLFGQYMQSMEYKDGKYVYWRGYHWRGYTYITEAKPPMLRGDA